MTESNRALEEVPALLEERRRYEAWLAALEARRDTTPAHVFERVQADYRNRLEQVAVQLATHRNALQAEQASLQSRLSLLEAEERMRRDERAELDLRAHVGELSGTDATAAFSAVDDALQLLVNERNGLQHRVTELAELLAERLPTDVAADVSPVAATSTTGSLDGSRAPGGTFDELAFLDAVVGHDAADASGSTASGSTASGGTASGGTASGSGPVKGSQAEQAAHPSQAATTAPVAASTTAPVAASAAAPVTTSSTAPVAVRDDEEPESLLAGLGGASGRPSHEPPLAANVTSNTPIVLRVSGAIEQSKTLKCNECGAMNYPTEWYCERCGAELAAL